MSQPSRAVILYLKANKIPFTECAVALRKGEHFSTEFEKVNPFKKVPAIEHKGFNLAESVAILRYLNREFPVADHWYPKDSQLRAKVDEVLEWQHLNLRAGGAMYFQTKVVQPLLTGKPVNEKWLKQHANKLEESLEHIETIFLKNRPFLNGNDISIADVLAVCEIEQPKACGYDVNGNRTNLPKWLENVREKLQPHYDEVHKFIFGIKQRIKAKL